MSYDRDNTCALDQFDFEFHKGNVYVLLGEKGAGKSTLCEIVTGIFRPVSGTGTIIGYDLDSLINARQVLGVCTQHPTLIPDFTALEHVSFYVSFRDIQLQMSMTEYATQLLKKVNLEKHLREHVSQFSGGILI
jgi:ABC-2 type transport system ATP-binding protein